MLWFIMLALIGSSLWVWLIRRNQWRRLLPEGNWIVTFDEQGVAVTAPPGDRREAKWQNLSRIALRTTDDGPWSADVFWGLHENGSAEATIVFPGGATGEQALLKEFGSSFRHEAV